MNTYTNTKTRDYHSTASLSKNGLAYYRPTCLSDCTTVGLAIGFVMELSVTYKRIRPFNMINLYPIMNLLQPF